MTVIKHEPLLQRAKVVRLDGDTVWVQPCLETGCAQCQLSGRCGQGTLARWANRRRPEIALARHASLTADTWQSLTLGDDVEVGIPSPLLLRATMLQFLLPLLGMLILGMLAEYAGVTDTGVALVSFGGLSATLWGMSLWCKPMSGGPYLHRVLPRGD